MSFDIAGGLKNLLPGPLDAPWGPYANLAAANAAIPNTIVEGESYRKGKRVGIGTTAPYVDHVWGGDYSDATLVPSAKPQNDAILLKANKSDIINDVTTGGGDKMLSAEQGKVIADAALTLIPGKNKFNKNDTTYASLWYDSGDRTLKSNTSSIYRASNRIAVRPGETWGGIIAGQGGGFFAEDMSPVTINQAPVYTAITGGLKTTVPIDSPARWLVINVRKDGTQDNTTQVEKLDAAATSTTSYEAYALHNVVGLTKLQEPVITEYYGKEPIDIVKDSFAYASGKNLIDWANRRSTQQWVEASKSFGVSSAGFMASNIFPVEEGEVYTVRGTGYSNYYVGGYFTDSIGTRPTKNGVTGENISWSIINAGTDSNNFRVPVGLGITHAVVNYVDAVGRENLFQVEKARSKTTVELYKALGKVKADHTPDYARNKFKERNEFQQVNYPLIWKKFPVFTNHWHKMDKDLVFALWGTSLMVNYADDTGGMPDLISCRRPPLSDTYGVFSYLTDKLMWDGQQYRRYDSGMFTQSGTFLTATNQANWDDGIAREGKTRYSTGAGAYVQFVVPVNAWQFNFIYRSEIAGDDCTVSITEGNGKMEVFNGSTWVEANGFVLSMYEAPASANKGNTTFGKRLKMRCKSGSIDSRATSKTVRITKTSDTAKRLLYWGVEWSEREFMITFVNAARGGHNFSSATLGLPKFQDNELYGFSPDLIMTELPLINEGGPNLTSIPLRTRQSYCDLFENWIFNPANAQSVYSRTSGLTTAEVVLFLDTPSIIVTEPTAGVNDNISATTKDWNFATEITSGQRITIPDVYRYVANWMMVNKSDQYACVNMFEGFYKRVLLDFGNYYDGFYKSGAYGDNYGQDNTHWNYNGARLAAKFLIPVFDFN